MMVGMGRTGRIVRSGPVARRTLGALGTVTVCALLVGCARDVTITPAAWTPAPTAASQRAATDAAPLMSAAADPGARVTTGSEAAPDRRSADADPPNLRAAAGPASLEHRGAQPRSVPGRGKAADRAGGAPDASGPGGGPASNGTDEDATGIFPLPEVGTHEYDQRGTSSAGPISDTMRLSIRSDPGQRDGQRWTLDGRTLTGNGSVEELSITQRPDGIRLSEYRISYASEVGSVALEFRPSAPVLLIPARPEKGERWSFELTSLDGCATVRTVGDALADPGVKRPAPIRFTATAAGTGRVGCPPLDITRTQDLRFGATDTVPQRIDTDLKGRFGGVPVTSSTSATRRDQT